MSDMADTENLKVMVDANVLFAGYGWPRLELRQGKPTTRPTGYPAAGA
jgi:hypothetical protein